ncbi:hypothetical protein FSP39_012888 [Pinctada imbricata]|uniref:Osteopetrosis-associated transmembrane protein 1 n=1 Tax=Pinctada imbricata TaxID=66713 RepID=A0AA88YEI3_PINIB|nr:hypothetical protein FSP39_012888 [Pinctada imbricata]
MKSSIHSFLSVFNLLLVVTFLDGVSGTLTESSDLTSRTSLLLNSNILKQFERDYNLLFSSEKAGNSITDSVPSTNITNPCKEYLSKFSEEAATFVKCAVDKSRPFSLCISCIDSYEGARSMYDKIEQDDNTKGGCHTMLLDNDRVQVLHEINKNMKALWDNAVCDACFKSNSINVDNNGTVTYTLSQGTVQFLTLYYNTSTCIRKYLNVSEYGGFEVESVNSSVCDECRTFYKALNTHFVDMQKASSHHVCMDLVDKMNHTRLVWGSTLHCTESYKENMKIIAIGIFMLFLPVIFYVSGRFCGQRKQIKLMTQKRMSKKAREYHYGSFNEDSESEGLDSHSSEAHAVVYRGNKIILPTE